MKNESIQEKRLVRRLVRLALEEDLGIRRKDVTSDLLFRPKDRINAVILAKEDLVFCGFPLICEVYRQLDPSVCLHDSVPEGAAVSSGTVVARLEGAALSLLRGERTALNFIQRMSGVATMTRRYVEALGESRVRLLDTRKTCPGHRALDKYAVRAGGGVNHRMGLYDMMMIKDNHKAAAGGLAPAIKKAQPLRRKGIRLEVEVESETEAMEAARCGCDVIMLDNMDNESIEKCARLIRDEDPSVKIEVSGGITLTRLSGLARVDIDFISTGAITHSAVAVDLSMEMDFKPLQG
jgi:nicotinate-nucleotide pyrophosphorylase (carboxylating)